MPLSSNRSIRFTRAAATLAFALIVTAPGEANGTQALNLTYVQTFVETTDDVTTSGVDYLYVAQDGAAASVKVVTPSGVTHAVALEARPDDSVARDPAAQCYLLATHLLPTAMRLAPGTRAQAGELDVTAGSAVTAVPVSFAAEALAPGLGRVYVYGDAAAPIRFSGALDYSRGIVMAATFTIATTSSIKPAYARRCQINLVLPKRQQAAPAHVL